MGVPSVPEAFFFGAMSQSRIGAKASPELFPRPQNPQMHRSKKERLLLQKVVLLLLIIRSFFPSKVVFELFVFSSSVVFRFRCFTVKNIVEGMFDCIFWSVFCSGPVYLVW